MRKECEKLFMNKRPNPLPLPTLKLSEPPGAVRPDGNQTPPSILPAPGQSPVNFNKQKSPIEFMLLNGASHRTLNIDQ